MRILTVILVVMTACWAARPQPLAANGRSLIVLHRISFSYPLRVTGPLHRRSGIFANYDDSGAWQGAWTVGLRYRACPAGRAGAIRLTVYRMPGSHSGRPFLWHLPRGARQYSRAVVDRTTSDAPTWQFDAAPKSTYYYKVDAIGGGPCDYWGIAATTN